MGLTLPGNCMANVTELHFIDPHEPYNPDEPNVYPVVSLAMMPVGSVTICVNLTAI